MYYFALSITTTSADARIYTFLIHARLVRSALRIYQAFRSTIWRSSDKLGQAGTNSLTVVIGTLTVGPARGRLTWFAFLVGNYNNVVFKAPLIMHFSITFLNLCSA